MTKRTAMEEHFRGIKENLLNMSGLVERMLHDAVQSLKTGDAELANKVIADDDEVNRLEKEIEKQAILLIATQQPVAKDLRKIISAIKIASDLERMGDYSENIAKAAIRLQGQKLIKPLVDIPRMGELAQQMVRMSIDSYLTESVELARKMAEIDHEIDHLFSKLVPELHVLAADNPAVVDQTTQLAFVARYIERIGDHATNIGESVIYLVTGDHRELND